MKVKYLLLATFLLTRLAHSQTLTITTSEHQSNNGWIAAPEIQGPYKYESYYFEDFGVPKEGSSWYGPFIWWKTKCDEWTLPVWRWDGKQYVEDQRGCYKIGGRRYVVVDWIKIKPTKVINPEPRA